MVSSWAAAAAIAASVFAPQGVRVEPLSAFDGRRWGDLSLNELSDPELKRQFKAGKGAVRAEGMSIPTVGSSGVRVDALMDARGAKAIMRAIRLEYIVNPPSLADLAEEFAQEPVFQWQMGRWEGWRLASFPSRGLIGVQGEGELEPRVWFLAAPEKAKLALTRFSKSETEIVDRPDPGENWDRVVAYSEVSSDITMDRSDRIPGDLDSRGRSRLIDRVEEVFYSMRRGALVYDRGGDSAARVNVRFGTVNDKGESRITVSASIDAVTPYGRFTISDSRNRLVERNFSSRTLDLVDDVITGLIKQTRSKVASLGPPPMSAKRDEALARLMDDITYLRRSQ
jgi:hypothetical protein